MVSVIDSKYMSYNFVMPTYQKFVSDVFSTLSTSYKNLSSSDLTPKSLSNTVREYGNISLRDIFTFFGLALLWTLLRYVTTVFLLKPLLSINKLGKNERRKAPESLWKLLFYSSTWCYAVYLLFFTKYDFFFNPPLTFYGWKNGQDVPQDIYTFYMVQLSFYFHSVYGTLYMDVWRKDSVVMLLHHFVTLLLVGFSYIFRFTNVGILVLFFHDITDIILEFTKLVLYHKTVGGKWTKICDFISTIGFVLFGTAWFVFRLYWYPLKALYAAGHTSVVVMGQEPPFFLFFNILLWILLGMNIYWFKFIVIMAYYVVTGKSNEVEDVREYDEDKGPQRSSDSDGNSNKKKQEMGNGDASRKNGLMKKHQ
uniref:ceramide synthase 1-like n=1 Tax=Styela clava TaxID=7725 RepID=UPI00193A2E4A|nr:ceramide synthase 1-like [Styela clava]